jgi:hypothetical protein
LGLQTLTSTHPFPPLSITTSKSTTTQMLSRPDQIYLHNQNRNGLSAYPKDAQLEPPKIAVSWVPPNSHSSVPQHQTFKTSNSRSPILSIRSPTPAPSSLSTLDPQFGLLPREACEILPKNIINIAAYLCFISTARQVRPSAPTWLCQRISRISYLQLQPS